VTHGRRWRTPTESGQIGTVGRNASKCEGIAVGGWRGLLTCPLHSEEKLSLIRSASDGAACYAAAAGGGGIFFFYETFARPVRYSMELGF